MNKHIADATKAFGLILTSLVAIFLEGLSTIASVPATLEETTPAPAKGKGGGKAKPEPEPDNTEDDLFGDGGEEEEEETFTLADLKAVGQKVIKAGKADKFKALLKKHGAENLGGLSEDDYAAVHAALTKLA